MPTTSHVKHNLPVVIIGGGPAGLMAAEFIAKSGYKVDVYDTMPSVGRKFLLAGVGGMNITHSEAADVFLSRYDNSNEVFLDMLRQFDANAVIRWIHELGIETFVGSSGRVFPKEMKAAPLLRAWLHRLRGLGVRIHSRHRWCGWSSHGELRFEIKTENGLEYKTLTSAATVLALGGASWQRLGSDGAWVPLLSEFDVEVNELQPSNCGFNVPWSALFQNKFAGEPIAHVGITCTDVRGITRGFKSQLLVSEYGLEGTGIYAISRYLRELLLTNGLAKVVLDLLPNHTEQQIEERLSVPRGKASFSNFLRKQLKLTPLHVALLFESRLHESPDNQDVNIQGRNDPKVLAERLKHIEIPLIAARPIDEAISSAGGVTFSSLTDKLMLTRLPGVFCAGEMLDWEAPTGGYLLTACLASGVRAGQGVLAYMQNEILPS